MKSVNVIREVKILPRATASHQPGSDTRWREETNVRSRVEQVSRVCIEPRKLFESRGPERENHSRMPDPYGWETRTVSSRWNAVSALSLVARQGGRHRGRRPDHGDTGIARELVRASSASCLEDADQCRADALRGVHREIKAPLGKARRPVGSIDQSKRGDDRYGGTSGNAKELRKGVRQS